MFEELKKSIDKGLEYAFMTTDKLTKAAKEMAKENNLTKEEAKKLLDHLVKKSEETKKTLEDNFTELVKTTLHKMNVPTKDEIKTLEARIKKLELSKKPVAKAQPKVVKKA
ncbi:MAG: phasin family protein [Bacteroidetes bacterium]|nr:phasin family protein [Bacteroidota bacterium]